ncbi:phosphatase PAP2 family protein [Bradyrhizobium sp. SSUT77]|uniref:phosphatase PAP2 family protein n=1 Tax=Bradyrhizobium sp. SSUT77 TaxID=3040603 RepID=UPI00244B6000|nr:phosphatase PAP2 family protein [Bradyrhizobium sp. SSUT77]MDH2345073.1 phosphatase PAP2 family protein [Bradyrhizobium sp. SSUT77]
MVDTDARTAWQLFHLNWLLIAAMGSVLLFGVILCGFSFEPIAALIPTAIAAALALIVYLYAFAKADRADPKLIFSLGAISQLFFVAIIMGPLTYVTSVANWPLQDQALLAIDRAMGMDPEAIARYVNDHDWLSGPLLRAYGLIKIMLLAVPLALTLTLRLVRLQVFVFAFTIALIITVAISTFVPAVGTWYGLDIAPSQFASLDSSLYTAQLRDILALREGSLRHLEMFKLSGIVSFPSFHAASAVLYMWALWPVRGLGGIAAALNLLMIAATPVIGAHYIIDVAGGIAVAAASIWAAKFYLQWHGRASRTSAAPAPSPVWQPSLAE